MSNLQFIIELYCSACDNKQEYELKEFNKIKVLQDSFKNEWKEQDICMGCAKEHHRETTNGLYSDEECDNQEKELLSKGFTYSYGRWTAKGGGVIISYRIINAIKLNKLRN